MLYILQSAINRDISYFLSTPVDITVINDMNTFATLLQSNKFGIYVIDEIYNIDLFIDLMNKSDMLFILINRQKKGLPTPTYSVYEFILLEDTHYTSSLDKYITRGFNSNTDIITITEDTKSSRQFLQQYFNFPDYSLISCDGISNLTNTIIEQLNKGIKELDIFYDSLGAGMYLQDIINIIRYSDCKLNFLDKSSLKDYLL